MKRLMGIFLCLLKRDGMSWSAGVPADNLHCKPSTCSYRSSLNPAVYRSSLIHTLRYEAIYILGRIRAIRDTQLYRRGIVLDPGLRISPDHREQKEILRGYKADIKILTMARPHLTLVDEELFYLGWKKGCDWGVRICHKQADLQEHLACTDLNSPSIPELTKHGQGSSSLPSQEFQKLTSDIGRRKKA